MLISERRNTERELYNFQMRIGVAGALVFAAFLLLLMRFAYLQVIQHDYYQTKAEDNRISVVPITPNRGNIVDRTGAILARNYSAYTLEISPSKVANVEAMIDDLATVIDIRSSDRTRFRRLAFEEKGANSLPIRTRLTEEEVARFAAHTRLATAHRTFWATSAGSAIAIWSVSTRMACPPITRAALTLARPASSRPMSVNCTA